MHRIEPPPQNASTLLAPLDGSRLAENALPAVVALARRLPARVTLLHAIERNAPGSVHGERHLRDVAEAEGYLAEVAGSLAAQGIAADWHVHVVPVVDIARSIATHANEQQAALIVLSTHEVTDPRSWLMGAVAQDVIRFAMAPALVVRTGRKGEPRPFDPAAIIVAMDSERQGVAGLPAAMMLDGRSRFHCGSWRWCQRSKRSPGTRPPRRACCPRAPEWPSTLPRTRWRIYSRSCGSGYARPCRTWR